MSYILDALKRNESDAQVGHAPGLHTQPVMAQKRFSTSWAWPALTACGFSAAVVLALLLQPWNKQPLKPEVIAIKAPEPKLKLFGDVDYEQYPKRERVALVAMKQPKPEVHQQPLPQEPISAGAVEGRDEVLEANRQLQDAQQEPKRVQGSQLEALFAQAVAETNRQDQARSNGTDFSQVAPLTQKPQAFQALVPSMNFNAHSYSSDASKRMIKVNGKELREGDWVDNSVQVRAILPAKVVLEMQGEQFTLPSLTDW